MKVTIIYKDHNATSFNCAKIKINKKCFDYVMDTWGAFCESLDNVDYIFIDGKMEYCRFGSFVKEETK